MKFFLDFEATDLSPYSARIVQIGCVAENSETFQTLVKADKPMHPEASKVTGIYDDDLKDACSCREALIKFIRWIKETRGTQDVVFVAHNGAGFDYPLLMSEMCRNGMSPFLVLRDCGVTHFFDSLVWCRENVPPYYCSSYTLGNLHEIFVDKKIENAHDALADCHALNAVMSRVCEKASLAEIDYCCKGERYTEDVQECVRRFQKKRDELDKTEVTKVNNVLSKFLTKGTPKKVEKVETPMARRKAKRVQN